MVKPPKSAASSSFSNLAENGKLGSVVPVEFDSENGKLGTVVPLDSNHESGRLDVIVHELEHKLFPSVSMTQAFVYSFKKPRTWLTVLLFVVSAFIGTWRAVLSESRENANVRRRFETDALDVAESLRRQVATSASSMYALASMVEVDGGAFLEQHFDKIAGTILDKYRGISNFDIAPFAVVKTKVPLAGNEGAIGHAMLSDYRRIGSTLQTIREKRAIVDGPLKLLQGGSAVIARFPVFTKFSPQNVPDIRSWWPDWSHTCCNTSIPLPGYDAESLPGVPDENGDQTYFYGLIEFVAKIDTLTADLNLDRVEERMKFQFRSKNPHPSMDCPVFKHSSDYPPGSEMNSPVVVAISIPDVQVEWELVAEPKGGWPEMSSLFLVCVISIYGGLIVSFFSYMVMESYALKIALAMQLLHERCREAKTILDAGRE